MVSSSIFVDIAKYLKLDSLFSLQFWRQVVQYWVTHLVRVMLQLSMVDGITCWSACDIGEWYTWKRPNSQVACLYDNPLL
jgi:hypothetical protein